LAAAPDGSGDEGDVGEGAGVGDEEAHELRLGEGG
jgi:hypothetical protein